ncbi:hypothetical protein CIB43_00187 [Mesomycoplasma hyopneumoniae]|uniref:Uncharacterized protein n=1 Tax=Mesomycoplasma hyopneumoniae TaxID=2099 RepID=A0A223M962_MESHO|nr:hypothetical protein CIB43_00187 [Mesomycoplasma hyopneumoniae]
MFSSIFFLAFFIILRYIWFILRYKKEGLNLSNAELATKYPKFYRIQNEKDYLKHVPILISGYLIWLQNKLMTVADKFDNYEGDLEEKNNFLYKIHLKYYIFELFLTLAIILSSTFLFAIFITSIFISKSNDLPLIKNIIFIPIAFFGLGILLFLSTFLIKYSRTNLVFLSENLLSNSIEKCKNYYKKTFFQFYFPKKVSIKILINFFWKSILYITSFFIREPKT